MISIAGVTVGTALLIVVLSVFNGFFDLIKGMLLNHDPDIRIETTVGTGIALDGDRLAYLENHPEIKLISPFVEGKALIAHRGGSYKVGVIKGVDPEIFSQMVALDAYFPGGEFDLSLHNRMPGVLMGRMLMGQLGVDLGDQISLLSAQSIQRSLTQFSGPRTLSFDVRGSYRVDEMHDASIIYMDKAAAQRLFNMRSAVSGIDIKLHDHDRALSLVPELQRSMGDDVIVRSWYDLQKPLYDVMNLEKWGAYVILMIIVLVAVLNIVGSLTMIVIQKTRDIALLRSYGMKTNDIRNIFLKQGFYIGLIGCGLGGMLGLLLAWMQDAYGLVKLAGAESFIIDAYPVSIAAGDVALVLAGSMILCVLASWYPANRASKVDISEALRYE